MRIALIACVGLLSLGVASAAPPKGGLGSIGTQQMPGAICKFNQAYTLGKAATSAWNINVTSVEYVATRVQTGKTFVYPKADTKLVVVRYTVHNPLPKEQRYQRSVKITAVTPDMKNYETREAYTEQDPHEPINQPLKPAQKIAAYSVIEVPAGEVDKLIIANAGDTAAPVARYPLAGQVKKLTAPYADPADASGSTQLKVLRVPMNQMREIDREDVEVLKVEQIDGPAGALGALPKTKTYVLVTFKVTPRNEVGGWMNYAVGWIYNRLVDKDGATYEPSTNSFYRASSFETLSTRVNYGESITLRKAYTVPHGVKLDYVILKTFSSRELRFELGGFPVK